ncbi:MAG: hypothetical protein C5B47_02255 [Verrucomicrobia bacterium]|nr:MAG: hypothetical protein C5B47_02255 [Verrucomicrobiota bacterium]
MDWKDRLEKRIGWIAIPGLIRYVAAANLLVFILEKLVPNYVGYLELDRVAILHGEIWRLISWIFVPQTSNYFWILFAVLWLWFLGDFLESAWGTFRSNVFFWLGIIGCTVGACIAGLGGGIFNWYLNLSILFAFATLDPDHPFYFFFVIPFKAKWLAWISLAFLVFLFVSLPLLDKLALLLSFSNYLIFLGPTLWREARHRKKTHLRRKKFLAESQPEDVTLHRCHFCGATEISAPDLDFRVSADGHEYCSKHRPSLS